MYWIYYSGFAEVLKWDGALYVEFELQYIGWISQFLYGLSKQT